jgi:hypothetical protein
VNLSDFVSTVCVCARGSFIVEPDDKTVFNDVQSRFAVKVGELPDEIDLTAYMPRPGIKEKYDD